MALNQFPALAALGWSVRKQPAFKTRVERSVNGNEWRALDEGVPRWTWTLTYHFLRSTAFYQNGVLVSGFDEYNTLRGFFLQQEGAAIPFLYDDPTDDSVSGQFIGTGDGVKTAFQLVRTLDPALSGGGYPEPIFAPQSVAATYWNGAPQASGAYTFSFDTGLLTFLDPPPLGTVITADFTYWFRVRFTDDLADFMKFMDRLWKLGKIAFISVLL